jgi:hypothetical protein
MSTTSDWIATAAATAVIAIAAGIASLIVSADGEEPAAASPSPAAAARPVDPQLALAKRLGDLVVGVRARAGGPVDVSVIPPDLRPIASDVVAITVGGRAAQAASCGSNCWRVDAAGAMRGRGETIAVDVGHERGRGRTSFRLPARTPPSGRALLQRATRSTGGARSVHVDETLSSGRSGIRAGFDYMPPDRMRYTSSDGGRGIVIGRRRWDFVSGRWEASPASVVPQPTSMWSGARFARSLGSSTWAGRPVRVVAAYRPDASYPAWFRLYVGERDRVLAAEMVAPAHFMLDRFSRYDAPARIVPPT